MKLSVLTFVILLSALYLSAHVKHDKDDEIVKITTNLVFVPVTVKHKKGGFITNLGKKFRIFEDGVEQEITAFETPDKPFIVALMLDISDSAEAKLKEIQDAAIAFTEQLKPNEQVMIIAFDRLIRLITEPSSDRRILLEAVRKTNTGGGTSIYDSVEKVIKRLEKVPGRKAIVIFSDGMDTTSERASFQTSLSLADEFSGLIYSIQYNTYKDIMAAQPDNNLSGNGGSQNLTSRGEPINRAYERGTIYLRTLTGNSGGRFYYADSVNNL